MVLTPWVSYLKWLCQGTCWTDPACMNTTRSFQIPDHSHLFILDHQIHLGLGLDGFNIHTCYPLPHWGTRLDLWDLYAYDCWTVEDFDSCETSKYTPYWQLWKMCVQSKYYRFRNGLDLPCISSRIYVFCDALSLNVICVMSVMYWSYYSIMCTVVQFVYVFTWSHVCKCMCLNFHLRITI